MPAVPRDASASAHETETQHVRGPPMSRLRVIPGAIRPDAVRALVLATGAQNPNVSVQAAGGGASIPATVDPLRGSPALQAEFGRDGVRLFAARVRGLQPGIQYELRASQNGTTRHVRFRTLSRQPPEDGLKVVVASCYYDFFHKDANYLAILNSAYCKHTAFKLLIGDNLYVDVAPDQRYIEGGYRETVARYLQYFWKSGYADVLAHSPNFTTWDDHEFWNNFPEEQCHLSRSTGRDRTEYIRAGTECLKYFQAVLNADVPTGNNLSYRIAQSPVVSFFVADMRSARTRFHDSSRRMMPENALQDLEAWAGSLDRPGVMVLGQPLWIEEGSTFDYTPPNFATQYERIWRAIAGAPRDILIVSGDVHHSRILEIGLGNNRIVYEFVSSPACHIPTVTSIVFGSYRSQDRGKPKVPESVTVGTGAGPALKPRLLRYFFGTGVPNTIGVLKFRAHPNGTVSVGCTFLDSDAQRPAAAEPLQVNSNTWGPTHERCHVEELFRLR